MSCGVGCRRSLDPALLWLWRRPVATAPIRPLAWEPPCATGVAQENTKNNKKLKKNFFKYSIGQQGPTFLIKQRMSYKRGPICTLNWARNPCSSVMISGKSISVEATTLGDCLGREGWLGPLRAWSFPGSYSAYNLCDQSLSVFLLYV